MEWKDVKKIDAHVHLIPQEKVEKCKGMTGNPYAKASVEKYS